MKTRTLIKLGAVAAVLLSSLVAHADGDPSTSTVLAPSVIVPYDGYLALDNTPMNGQLNLRFELYDAATGGNMLWTEDQDAVNFYNGRFAVGLGSVTALTSVILDADKVYLGIKIDDGTGTYVALSGRQEIKPVPYSAWSANASDFSVAGNLNVEGNSQFKGQVEITRPADTVGLRLNMGAVWDFVVASAGALQIKGTGDGVISVWTDGTFRVNANTGHNAFSVDGVTGNTEMRGTLGVRQDATFDKDHHVKGSLTVDGDITNLTRSEYLSTSQSGTGQSATNLIPYTENSICFLTRVETNELDSSNENGTCEVRAVNNNTIWAVQARITNSTDGYVRCSAQCLTW